ncbi:MAG: hypothetical protein WCG75_00470 [Armatimonadota bacterium]
MKNVIKIFVAIAVMGVISVSAFAQGAGPGGAKSGAGQKGGAKAGGPGGPGGGQRRGGGMMGMDTEILAKLGLNAKQNAAVKALKDATKAKSEALMKSLGFGTPPAKGSPPAQRPKPTDAQKAQFKAIGEGYHSGLAKILTPAQMTSYDKELKAAREKMRAAFGGGKPGGPGGDAAGKGKGKGKGGTPPPTP